MRVCLTNQMRTSACGMPRAERSAKGPGSRGPISLVVGPIEVPPLSGQALVTNVLVDRFRSRRMRLVVVNTIRRTERSWRARGDRIVRLSLALAMILVARLRGSKVAYVSVLASHGMYHTALCALLARILGYSLFLHHHTYSYIKHKQPRMSLLVVCGGKNAVHIANCKRMSTDMRTVYPEIGALTSISNVFTVDNNIANLKRGAELRRFAVGHMSSLTRDKGFFTVVDVFKRLLSEGVDASLVMAGPCLSKEVEAAVNELQKEFPDAFDYRDYVTGRSKIEFFKDIDAFLFPSTCDESQGIVNLEALAGGVPVIAYGHCCTADDIVPPAGLIIPLGHAFAEAAVPLLKLWGSDRSKLRAASAAARRRFGELAVAGRRELEEFVKLVGADASPERTP